MTINHFPTCQFNLNDFLAPHLQNDIDAILDCYRNLRRRNQHEEARFVWIALDYLSFPKKKRYSQAEKLIPLLESELDDYLHFIPKFAWGEHEKFAKIPTMIQSNSQVKATLQRYFPTNKISIARSPAPNKRLYVHFQYDEQNISLILEIIDRYVKYYANLEFNRPYIFKNTYYFPVIETFSVLMGSSRTEFCYPDINHSTRGERDE